MCQKVPGGSLSRVVGPGHDDDYHLHYIYSD